MATAVKMPQLGYEMVEGAVQTWLKKEGDRVNKGEIIAEIETDKSAVELEADATGILRKVIVETGKVVPVHTVIAVIGEANEQINWAEFGVSGLESAFASASPKIASPEPIIATPPVATPLLTPTYPNANNGGTATTLTRRVLASPLARRTAADLGIDIAKISGTGPGGRVKRSDVEMFYANTTSPHVSPEQTQAKVTIPSLSTAPAPVGTGYEEVELSRMRQTIARRTSEAKQQMPHIYLTNEIDMGEALKLRQTINTSLEQDGLKVSVNDLVLKAVAKALQKFPALNSSYQGTKLLIYKDINLAFAVATEGGLITPVIRNADQKSVSQIAKEAHNLAEKARKGNLHPDDYSGGTFSISNLGMYDVSHFVAVINQPQAAILAVAATKPKVVVVGGNEAEGYQFGVRQEMAVTISVDHRATDGAIAARFLQELKTILQKPFGLLL
jgi:pyruvate dehydrogenase E2 component (dihydrolipoamide acetyltransferase)